MTTGRFFFEAFLDAVGAPEIDTDEQYFKNKRFTCVLGENTYNDKTNLTVATYIPKEETEVDKRSPVKLLFLSLKM